MTATTLRNNQIDSFLPNPLLRHHFLQTVMSVWRPADVNWFLEEEQPFLVDAGADHTGYDSERSVRLLAYYSSAHTKHFVPPLFPESTMSTATQSRGLVLMLHGWRGCSHSTYSVVVTDSLLRAGYDVVRLNLRDHGPSIHYPAQQLNTGLFRGTLIEEVEVATHRIAEMAAGRPFIIVGPSMGGNFALRLAIRHTQKPIPNLCHVIAISPAINPASATDALDADSMYRRYFRRQWLRSLQAKMDAYPEHFSQLRAIEGYGTVREMTEWIIPRTTDYQDTDEYFYHYSVHPGDIPRLQVDTTIITAKDDPVIPVRDFLDFPSHPFLNMHVLDYGGHVGFIDLFSTDSAHAGQRYTVQQRPIRHCLPEMILSVLEADRYIWSSV